MKQSLIEKKYAEALFQLALEKNQLERIESELNIVKEAFASDKDILFFLSLPKISKEQKRDLLKKSFADFSSYIVNTLLILTDRHRVDYIIPMINEFIKLSYDRKGIAKARVESVRPLTNEEKVALSTTFASKVKKTSLEIENVVNSDLLGGLKIQIGNRIFDGSLRGKLNNLKRELIG